MMNKKISITQKLEQILENQAFDKLEEFRDARGWKKLKKSERDLLGLLFIMLGEAQLRENDKGAFETFQIAAQVVPTNVELLYRLVISLVEFEDTEEYLSFAIHLLEKIKELEPASPKPYHYQGNLLVRLGLLTKDQNLLSEADQKFEMGEEFLEVLADEDFLLYHWHWGVSLFCLGKLSEEALDFYKAISHYQIIMEKGFNLPKFWNDYGNALVDLFFLLSRPEMLHEATKMYKNAIDRAPGFLDAYLNAACSYLYLYQQTFNEDHFQEANKLFEQGANLADDPFLYGRWGELLLHAGKVSSDLERIEKSIGIFSQAIAQIPKNPVLYIRKAEAQVLFAIQEESINLIKEAESTILEGLKLDALDPEAWYVYGLCLNAQGEYFDDANYYQQAITKFQEGLNILAKADYLWYGMAVSSFQLGVVSNSQSQIEKALHYFSRTLEFTNFPSAQFWNDWGVALLKLGESKLDRNLIESALSKFHSALHTKGESLEQNHSANSEFLYNYSYALDLMGNITAEVDFFDEALQVLAKILQQDPEDSAAHYSIATVLSHIGILTSDVECFQKANEHFQLYLNQETEDETAWNDWGASLIEFAELVQDPACPSACQQLFEEAELKFQHAIVLGNIYAYYNLACLYSLTKNFPASLHYLERAQQANALPSIDDILHDEWLDNLRDEGYLTDFISGIKKES